MKKTRISGIGVVSPAGITADSLWETLCKGESIEEKEPLTSFKPDYPSSKLRRMNRYCKMALYASKMAWEDGGTSRDVDPLSRGTIFSTGYGAMSAHVKFCRETAKGEPDFCSPTVFTGIVPNSCVGTVCMFLDCKGASTVLSGGNQLEYSQLLLESQSVETVLCGGIDEYTPELFQGLKEASQNAQVKLAEGCVVLAMEEMEDGGYGTLEKTATTGLTGFPLIYSIDPKENERRIQELLTDFADEKLDAAILSGNHSYFDEIENQAFRNVYPNTVTVTNLKEMVGETIGCGFAMSVAVAALCIKHGKLPEGFSEKSQEIPVERILVTGFDTAGNYMCAVVGK